MDYDLPIIHANNTEIISHAFYKIYISMHQKLVVSAHITSLHGPRSTVHASILQKPHLLLDLSTNQSLWSLRFNRLWFTQSMLQWKCIHTHIQTLLSVCKWKSVMQMQTKQKKITTIPMQLLRMTYKLQINL